MKITLNHTIVPSYENVESARFYERMLDFEFLKEWSHFAVVKVNQTLTLDFINSDNFSSLHYAFKICEQQFYQTGDDRNDQGSHYKGSISSFLMASIIV